MTVPIVFSDPTVMTTGEFPGDMTPPRMRRAVVGHSGIAGRSDDDDTRLKRALDGFAQRIRRGRLHHRMTEREVDHADVVLLPVAIAQSMPAMTSLVSPEPSAPSTRMLISLTPGATPPVYRFVTDPAGLPDTIPATCVPCP